MREAASLTLRVLCGVVVLAQACSPVATSAGEPVRINGSGSSLDLMKPMLAAYAAAQPGTRVEVRPPLGSSGAMMALLDGALDLAVIGRAVRPEEADRGAQGVAYGRSPLLLVTHAGVKVERLSTAELEEIFSGRRTTWPDGQPVRLVLRPVNETNTKLLAGLSPGMAAADAAARRQPWAMVAVTDPEANELVARTPGAIGAATLTSVLVEGLPLSRVALDGVRGDVADLARGAYPLAKEIVFVTTARSSPQARAIVDFALSPAGRAVAERAGVVVARPGPEAR